MINIIKHLFLSVIFCLCKLNVDKMLRWKLQLKLVRSDDFFFLKLVMTTYLCFGSD